MNIIEISIKASTGALTCSEVAEILANQPTHDETSHAHLHTLDTFQYDPIKWVKNYETMTPSYQERNTLDQHIENKKRQWAPDAHLQPKGPTSGVTYSDDANLREFAKFNPVGVLQDERRLAQSNKYNERAGLAAIPAVPAVRNDIIYVLRKPVGGKGKPERERIPTRATANSPPYNTELYIQEGSSAKIITATEEIQPAIPLVPAEPKHSMFPDSEAMILYLTAALLSDAGINILNTLKAMPPGNGKTVGLFSKTAVRIVRALKNANKAPEIIDRNADVLPGTRHDFTGTFTQTHALIDHVVIAMSISASSSLTVVTYYPSSASTLTSIKTDSASDEDIEEHVFGTHTKSRQLRALPSLTW